MSEEAERPPRHDDGDVATPDGEGSPRDGTGDEDTTPGDETEGEDTAADADTAPGHDTEGQDNTPGDDAGDRDTAPGNDAGDDAGDDDGGQTTEATRSDTTTLDAEALRENVIEVGVENAGGELGPAQVERVFSLMERAVGNDALEGTQLDRLLEVLERAVAGGSEASPATVVELVSVLEDAIVDADDLEDVDVDGILSVVENAIVGTTGADGENLQETFDVLETAIRDPGGVDPEDVERFRSGLEGALLDLTDSSRGGLDALFPLFGSGGDVDPEAGEAIDGDALDMFRIARIGAGLTQRATGYSMESGLRTGTRMAYAVANAESPSELLTETRAITLDELQRAGIDIGDRRTDWLEQHEDDLVSQRPMTRERLREHGERLLSKSAEVGRGESFHPAFPAILESVAPDEARILRLLAEAGTQPALDVRHNEYVPFQSRLIAGDLTMVGSDAGCRDPDRTPLYLENLERLGLVAFSEEPVEDLKRYQVLEAQPHVEAAREAAKRPKNDYRSVHLTELGAEFCRVCLPVDVRDDRPASRFRRDD